MVHQCMGAPMETDDWIYVEELYDQEDKVVNNNSSSSEDREKELAPMATDTRPDPYNEIGGSTLRHMHTYLVYIL